MSADINTEQVPPAYPQEETYPAGKPEVYPPQLQPQEAYPPPHQGQPQGDPGQLQGAYPGQLQGAYPGQLQGAYPGQLQGEYPGQPQQLQGGYPGQPQPQQQQHNNVVVKSQPKMQVVDRDIMPNNYLGLSIFATFCCCLPFGLISLFYSTKVDNAWIQGDVEGAYSYSRRAKYWNIAAIVTGLILGVTLGVVVGVARGLALTTFNRVTF